MCSLVRFCSSVHCRPGFKLCPRKLHSFFVQLLPDFVHLQLLQSSIQFSPISLDLPSPSRHCESAPVLKPDISKGRAKLQSIFVQLLPDSVHMQLLQSSFQLSPTSLAAPLLSTQATAFSPNLADDLPVVARAILVVPVHLNARRSLLLLPRLLPLLPHLQVLSAVALLIHTLVLLPVDAEPQGADGNPS